MTGKEIKELILANNKIIEESLSSNFTLNKNILTALKENEYYRSICIHKFDENGYCIYCDKEEKDGN